MHTFTPALEKVVKCKDTSHPGPAIYAHVQYLLWAHDRVDCQNAPVVPDPIYSRHRNPIQLQVSTHMSQFHSSSYPDTISLWNKLYTHSQWLTISFKCSVTLIYYGYVLVLALY